MSWFGKEDNVEKAQSKAIEEDINREARKVENQKYQEERKKVKIKQAEERAVRRANAPGLGQSLATGMKGLGSFANSMSKPSTKSRSQPRFNMPDFTGYNTKSKGSTKMPDVMNLYGKKKGKGGMNMSSFIRY